MRKRPTPTDQRPPRGSGPLAGSEPATGGPIDDPSLADRANPRWDEPTAPAPDAQPLANPDGTPNVMPPREMSVPVASPEERRHGTREDQAARPLDPEVGRDNIREGRDGGTPNPAMAEGGDDG